MQRPIRALLILLASLVLPAVLLAWAVSWLVGALPYLHEYADDWRPLSGPADGSGWPAAPAHPQQSAAPVLGATPDHLLWWVHLSDLHLSAFRDPQRASHLRVLCDAIVKTLAPQLVLVTGTRPPTVVPLPCWRSPWWQSARWRRWQQQRDVPMTDSGRRNVERAVIRCR